MKYSYLKKFLNLDVKDRSPGNWFYSLDSIQIDELNSLLNGKLPDQLIEFYTEIGYGSLNTNFDSSISYAGSISNYIEPPSQLIDFLKNGEDNEIMTPSAFEDLQPGDLPFFEMYDSSYFLIMKLNSDNPNAVWYDTNKVADSFEEFIHRLYYESPTFYGKYM